MRIPADNAAEFLTRIVPFVDSDGARNLNAICRELGIPYQTLRFRMNRLKEQGLSVLPLIDSDKLGLQRVRAAFDIPKDTVNPNVIFGGLHQKAGLKNYFRTLFSQRMICEFLVPKGSTGEFDKLLQALEEMRLIENYEYKPILWKEIFMMRTELFDYGSGEWDVDFPRLLGDPSRPLPESAVGPAKFDYNDLLIIKTLEMDPWIKVVDLAKTLKIPVGDVSYHLNRHVLGRKLIPSFRLRWVGTKDAWLKHSIIGQSFTFERLTAEEVRHAMSVMSATPFVWDHMLADDGTYITEFGIPLPHFLETQSYISDRLRPLGLKPDASSMDWSLSSTFTIPYTMFENGRGWELEAEKALGYVLQMISQYDKPKA